MTDIVVNFMPWVLSAITIYMNVLAGNKSKNAWAVGLVNQFIWLVWIYASGAWGLLPMNAALWVVYSRNHLRWNKGGQGFKVANKDKRVTPKGPKAKAGLSS